MKIKILVATMLLAFASSSAWAATKTPKAGTTESSAHTAKKGKKSGSHKRAASSHRHHASKKGAKTSAR